MTSGRFFFVGGAKHCGTTWLYHTLSTHSDIWLPPVKELHCYKRPEGFNSWRQRALETLAGRGDLDFFKYLREPETADDYRFMATYKTLPAETRLRIIASCKEIARPRWGGDVDPNLLPLRDERIAALEDAAGPDALFLFVVRDPVQRHWSRFKKKMSKVGIRGLEDMVGPFIENLPATPMTYEPHIPRWLRRLGDRVILLDYDALAERPEQVLGTIAARLNIPDNWQIRHERLNTGPAIPMPLRLQELAEEHFASDRTFIRSLGFGAW